MGREKYQRVKNSRKEKKSFHFKKSRDLQRRERKASSEAANNAPRGRVLIGFEVLAPRSGGTEERGYGPSGGEEKGGGKRTEFVGEWEKDRWKKKSGALH